MLTLFFGKRGVTVSSVERKGRHVRRPPGTSTRDSRPVEADGTPGHEAAIVNRRFAAMYFPNEDPIGRRIRVTSQNARGAEVPWVTIVGISATVRQDIASEGEPVVYL